jgi:hypothetical protein
MLKAHKDPLGHRFVSASHRSPLAPLSLHLNNAFDALRDPVDNLWRDTLLTGGLSSPSSWILHKPDTLLSTLKLANLSLRQAVESEEKIEDEVFSTYDFSTLYTKIPHTELKSRMKDLFTLVFKQQATRVYGGFSHLAVSESGAEWVKANHPHKPNTTYHTASSLSSFLDLLIDNCFVSLGDRVYRQIIGIPMGTNCAVFLANFFLFTFELEFAITSIASGQSAILLHFAHTVRYVDDILSINNPFMDQLRDTIYPSYLTLNREHSGSSVPFLDFLLYSCRSSRTPLRSRLFDKRTLPKLRNLPLTHYPHSTSFLPSKFKYNCILSQAHRLLRRCTSKRSFTYNLAVVIKQLIDKGLSPHRLFRKARCFAKSHLPSHFSFSSTNSFLAILRHRVTSLQSI